MEKFQPKDKEELKTLCNDENVCLGDIDISLIEDMSSLFYYSKRVNFSGIEEWDVSNVVDMNHMFFHAKNFNHPLKTWDTGNVVSMRAMFSFTEFNQPLDSWDVSSVIDMGYMFSHSVYNQPLGSWNLGNVKTLEAMFWNSKFNQPINSWKIEKVKNMRYMFEDSEFNQPLDLWKIDNVENMSHMFCGSKFNHSISHWNLGNVANKQGMFFLSNYSYNLKAWGESVDENELLVRNPKNQKYHPKNRAELERLCGDLKIGLGEIDTSLIDNMEGLFENTNRTNFEGIETWDMSKVKNTSRMFAYSLFDFPISSWNMSNVEDMSSMFAHSSFNQPLDAWNVGKVKNMERMFYGSAFNHPLKSWNVENVENMSEMFADSAFTHSVSSWTMRSVKEKKNMFVLNEVSYLRTIRGINMQGIKTESKCLKDIFEKNISIPLYQRDYEWREKEVGEMLESVIESFRSKRALYLGTLVFFQCEDRCEIIDGQQRLGTLFLILEILGIENGFGELRADVSVQEKIKNFINKKIKEERGIEKYITKNIEFSCVYCTSLDECFTLFDDINSKGKKYETYELIKTYHLGKMSERGERELIDIYAKKFDEIAQRARGARIRKLFYELLSLARMWVRDKSSKCVREKSGVKREVFERWVFEEFCPKIDRKFEMFDPHSSQDMGILRDFGESRGFFEYLFYFDSLLDRVEAMPIWRELRVNDERLCKYLRFVYEMMMLVYLDKFRKSNLAIAHLWIFRCVYSLLLQQKITRSSARDWGKELLAILYHSGSEREAIFRLSKKIESNKKKEKLKNKELYTIKAKEREQYHIPKFGGEQ